MTDFDAVMVDAMLEVGAKLEEFEGTVARSCDGVLSAAQGQMAHSIVCHYGRSMRLVDDLIDRTFRVGLLSESTPCPVHSPAFEALTE